MIFQELTPSLATKDAVLKSMLKAERKMPEGLDYFSSRQFQERVHGVIEGMRNK